MNKMIIYKTLKGAIFVPCDSIGNPDLSRVPDEYQCQLRSINWDVYTVTTSKDKQIFGEVCRSGYSIQKMTVKIVEGK